ncbi:hypothetical protein H2198_009134 [Neophaeococcomyces mojaviensis]|uniref:Uncharacterized protein n=1 Tax=Neophaeococcomyces mojaviensis TaxID=3383035 RepID=A0ACC2ZV99_9EURO|nr:hypothetical protein H2198_009134 [Knufia sp. JES_112]
MGFFSRRHRPVHHPQTQTTALANAPFPTPPPSYSQPVVPYAAPVYYQQAQFSNAAFNDDFISEQDLSAIQNAIDQDTIIDQFSNIISGIDEEQYNDNDEDFSVVITETPGNTAEDSYSATRAIVPSRQPFNRRQPAQPRTKRVAISTKVSFYSNATLPADLPRLRVYIPTWPLICLAAQYSANVYKSPQSSHEREVFVSADARMGTKAMVMKSVPCDDKKTLVFAIRGTSILSLRDWNVNLHTAPVSPAGFLDDHGNLCHSGFLRVAKAMIRPIAMRLRTLLEENPSRASCSLLITGHSAGGAVAALLFSHMLSSVESELSILTGCFKRVHCVTFGAPPVTLLPLTKPNDRRFHKSLFFSFMNEGDPVVRAEKAYIRSLVDLLSSPLPIVKRTQQALSANRSFAQLHQSVSKLDLTLSRLDLTNSQPTAPLHPLNTRKKHSRWNLSQPVLPMLAASLPQTPPSHHWPVPTATLSNAGRLVIMRVPRQSAQSGKASNLRRATSNHWERDNLSKVTAHTVTDEQLRRVVFGDPSVHAMEVYLRRVDMLALKAVTARG